MTRLNLIPANDKPVKSLAQIQKESIEKYGPPGQLQKYEPAEKVSTIEFHIRPGYIICNILWEGTWRTSSWPDNVSIIEFLLAGSIANAYMWPEGRDTECIGGTYER